jgi:Ca-activated chloride channel family protein
VEVEVNKTTEEDAPVFVVVEEMPEFTGGAEAMKTFLIENIHYPEDAKTQNQQGKVFVSFVINPVGKVVSVGLARSSGFDLLDKEAMRVIGAMPDWKPGKQRGQAVNVSLVLPVNFSLDTEKPATEQTK